MTARTLPFALAALAAYVAVLFLYQLLPGSLANAQYALGDAAFAQCIANTGEILHCRNFGYPGGSPKPFGLPVSLLALVAGGGDGQVALADVRWAHTFVMAFAFAGACAFFARLVSNRWLGIAGALLYLASPAVLMQSSYGALQLGMALLPTYLLVDASLPRALRDGRPGRVALAWLLVAAVRTWAIYLDGYSFLFSGLLAGCWFLASGIARREIARTLVVLVAYGVAAGVAALAYKAYIASDSLQSMPLAFYRAAGVDVMTLVLPPRGHPVYGLLGLDHGFTPARTWSDGSALMGTFLGYATLPAVLVVALQAWRRRRPPAPGLLALLAAGSLALLLSLGPSLKVADYRPEGAQAPAYSMPEDAATASLPTAKLYTSAPGIRNARALARWLVVTRLALVALVVCAAACLLRRRRGAWLAVGLLLLAAVEVMPGKRYSLHVGQRIHGHAHWVYNDLSADFAAGTRQGERVFLLQLHEGAGGNEFVANTLCARADVACYNAGGDKASVMVRKDWPAEILAAKAGRDVPGQLASAFAAGLVDVVVVPYVDLRAIVYGTKAGEVPVAHVRARAEALAEALGGQLVHGAYFSFIRMAPAPARLAPRLAPSADPLPGQRHRIRVPPAGERIVAVPEEPARPLATTPAELDGCRGAGGRSVVIVRWDASGHGVQGVEIHVADDGAAPPKLWTAQGVRGRRETGPWIREGSVIELRAAGTGTVLARKVMVRAPCGADAAQSPRVATD